MSAIPDDVPILFTDKGFVLRTMPPETPFPAGLLVVLSLPVASLAMLPLGFVMGWPSVFGMAPVCLVASALFAVFAMMLALTRDVQAGQSELQLDGDRLTVPTRTGALVLSVAEVSNIDVIRSGLVVRTRTAGSIEVPLPELSSDSKRWLERTIEARCEAFGSHRDVPQNLGALRE